MSSPEPVPDAAEFSGGGLGLFLRCPKKDLELSSLSKLVFLVTGFCEFFMFGLYVPFVF